jgi:hypothetical protein
VNFDEEGDYNRPCRTPVASLGIVSPNDL